MKTLYQPTFIKDLKALRSSTVFPQINKLVFEDIPACTALSDISNFKKLKGEENVCRIKVGDYRIGLMADKDIVIFERVLHCKEIYRYFP